jgi:two-component system cell cycle response regulator
MGDEVLVKVAAIFREHVRKVDTVARYGGEEFVVLMPQALAGEAVHLCERLRVLVASYPWHKVHPQLSVTISMGVSSNLEVPGHEKMLAEADLNLYQAKRSGKNRVCS